MSNSSHKKITCPRIAIIGASGAVGQEMLACLANVTWQIEEISLWASPKSAGKKVIFQQQELVIQDLSECDFQNIDIALFAAGGNISKQYAPLAEQAGCYVIDNSSAFRMVEDVALIVPEINAAALEQTSRKIIANPNCTTIISLMALAPLHQEYGLQKVIASSYQAVSGSGMAGIQALEAQTKAWHMKETVSDLTPYPQPIAFNVIPQIDVLQDNDYTKEEMKMHYESRKILNNSKLNISCTCVRVPVFRSHAVSIVAQFQQTPKLAELGAIYRDRKGIVYRDKALDYPTPLEATCADDCIVGRVRKDIALDNALSLWVVGDQVKKGAALNAVQIAGLLVE